MTNPKKDWADYIQLTKDKPPSPLLVRALGFVVKRTTAIDVGGGALNDTRYLLEQGFDVTAVDADNAMAAQAKTIPSEKFHYTVSSFLDFQWPKDKFDIASAMFSLPFNPPETFKTVLTKIKQSLVPEGIFCGQFFGVRDTWSSNPHMTFHTKELAEQLLSDLEILLLQEIEKDGQTANGTAKHWHFFNFIAKKI